MSPVSYRKPTPPWNGISPLRERHHRRGDRRATGGQTVHQNQATPATTRRVDRRTRRRARHARTGRTRRGRRPHRLTSKKTQLTCQNPIFERHRITTQSNRWPQARAREIRCYVRQLVHGGRACGPRRVGRSGRVSNLVTEHWLPAPGHSEGSASMTRTLSIVMHSVMPRSLILSRESPGVRKRTGNLV